MKDYDEIVESHGLAARMPGLDLCIQPSSKTTGALQQLMRRYPILIVPNQTLTADEQVSFFRSFGEVEARRYNGAEGSGHESTSPYITRTGGQGLGRRTGANRLRNNAYRVARSFTERPNKMVMAYVASAPTSASSKLHFASTVRALESLPPTVLDELAELSAVHTFPPGLPRLWSTLDDEGHVVRRPRFLFHLWSQCTHPIAIQHPDTGQSLLFVNRFLTDRITRRTAPESALLLDELFSALDSTENCFTYNLESGDVVLWDNFLVQYAPDLEMGEALVDWQYLLGSRPSRAVLSRKQDPLVWSSNPGQAPPLSRSPTREQIFVLAFARSYSTLTSAMLGCHPEVYAFPEMVLFTGEPLGQILPQERDDGFEWYNYRGSGPVRAVAQIVFGGQDAEHITRATQWLRRYRESPAREVFDILVRRIEPLLPIEKSPDSFLTLDNFKTLLDAYPRARCIHIVRNPVSAIRSWAEQQIGRRCYFEGLVTPEAWANDISSGRWDARAQGFVWYGASMWYRCNRLAEVFGDRLGPDRYLRVRGEDIAVADSTASFTRITQWLGVSDRPEDLERMRHPEAWDYAFRGPSRAPGGGDFVFFANPSLDSQRIPTLDLTQPPEWEIPAEAWNKISALAARLGYVDSYD